VKILKILTLSIIAIVLSFSAYSGPVEADEAETIVYAEGNVSQIGKQYGEQAKAAIVQNVELFKLAAKLVDLTANDLEQAAADHQEFLQENNPELLEQYKSMASAAGVALGDILAFNALEEKVVGDGCTTIIATGSATQGGKAYYHKNRDASRGFKQVVLQIQPENGNKFIGITSAGSSGIAMGINEHGVSVGNNVLHTWDTGRGHGNLTVIRMALEKAGTAQEALSYIQEIPRASGSVYGIADQAEGAFLETTHSAYAVKWVVDEAMAHTNHYILPEMEQYEALDDDPAERNRWSWYISTEERLDRATHLLNERLGKISEQDLIKISEDQDGEEKVYWIDAQYEVNGRGMGSVSTSTFDGSKLRMWSQLGQPSAAPAIPFEVDRPHIPSSFSSGAQSGRIEKTKENRD
jgi:predicted choloylglycine hydrolase